MGQKDITQKSLEGFPDVFADIINALLYQGETVVREENLFPFATESFFPVTGHRLKNQFQDVSMMEHQRKLPFVQYTKALAGDKRFEEIWQRFKEQAEREAAGKEGITMCRLLDSYWDDGVNTGMERGKAEGLAEGKISTLISNLKILMEKLNLTLTQSMDMLDVADDDRLTILEHFKQA